MIKTIGVWIGIIIWLTVTPAMAWVVVNGDLRDWESIPALPSTPRDRGHDSVYGMVREVRAAADPQCLYVLIQFDQPRPFQDPARPEKLAAGVWDDFEYLEIDANGDGKWDFRTQQATGKRAGLNNLAVLGTDEAGRPRGRVVYPEGHKNYFPFGPRGYFSPDMTALEMRLPRTALGLAGEQTIGLRVRLHYRDTLRGAGQWVTEYFPAENEWLQFTFGPDLNSKQSAIIKPGSVALPPSENPEAAVLNVNEDGQLVGGQPYALPDMVEEQAVFIRGVDKPLPLNRKATIEPERRTNAPGAPSAAPPPAAETPEPAGQMRASDLQPVQFTPLATPTVTPLPQPTRTPQVTATPLAGDFVLLDENGQPRRELSPVEVNQGLQTTASVEVAQVAAEAVAPETTPSAQRITDLPGVLPDPQLPAGEYTVLGDEPGQVAAGAVAPIPTQANHSVLPPQENQANPVPTPAQAEAVPPVIPQVPTPLATPAPTPTPTPKPTPTPRPSPTARLTPPPTVLHTTPNLPPGADEPIQVDGNLTDWRRALFANVISPAARQRAGHPKAEMEKIWVAASAGFFYLRIDYPQPRSRSQGFEAHPECLRLDVDFDGLADYRVLVDWNQDQPRVARASLLNNRNQILLGPESIETRADAPLAALGAGYRSVELRLPRGPLGLASPKARLRLQGVVQWHAAPQQPWQEVIYPSATSWYVCQLSGN